MVEVILVDDFNQTLAAAKRPVMMKYQSGLIDALSSLFYAIPLIFNLSEQKQTLEVVLMEEFVESRGYPFVNAYVLLSSKYVHVYSASIHFRASLSYLQYFMFSWFYTFGVLSICCLSVSIFSTMSFMTTIFHIILTHFIVSLGNSSEKDTPQIGGYGVTPALESANKQPPSAKRSSLHPAIEPVEGGFVLNTPQDPPPFTIPPARVDLRFLTSDVPSSPRGSIQRDAPDFGEGSRSAHSSTSESASFLVSESSTPSSEGLRRRIVAVESG
eukprot:TRINITY_DN1240_c0_g2_i3.p1 TRINITY_DN1240_c0_g2~~TRINITY_DN1240_c0_g2_i3.p1  ORF type:complete len:271 (-),score=43.98 TRINITY_DN1240_c0_g2_i3:302-1114(-)